MYKVISVFFMAAILSSCGGFQAKRVDAEEGDKLALQITDKWVDRDTEQVVDETLKQIKEHAGFKRYLAQRTGRRPKVFIAEVQNDTSEPYFPIEDLNDELLHRFSASGQFILIDAAARDRLLKEIKYQNDGMVDPKQISQIGKQAGADLLIFGAVRMQPRQRGGKTIKQYTVNMRMTDIESSIEVLRTRARVQKFSKQSRSGW